MKKIDKKNAITAYKATNKDMRCRGYQYELGKWYWFEGGEFKSEDG